MATKTRRVPKAASPRRRIEGRALGVSVSIEQTNGGSVFISVPRQSGNAVTRNRIRRQLGEILRLGSDRIKPGANLRISARLAGQSYGQLEQELWDLLGRAGAVR